MAEDSVKIEQKTNVETAEGEQPVAKPRGQKVKTATAAVSEQKVPATATGEIMAAIKNMTVLELAELVKALEAAFGVSAVAPVAAAPAAPSAVEASAAAVEEQTEFSVILKEVGANKINVIKAVRELTTLGLKESKDLVESAPKAVQEGVSREAANTAKKKLEEAGAAVEIK